VVYKKRDKLLLITFLSSSPNKDQIDLPLILWRLRKENVINRLKDQLISMCVINWDGNPEFLV
jgi:hypothetical protein